MRAAAQALLPGVVLGDRYRLTRLVGAELTRAELTRAELTGSESTGAGHALWQAEDLILARRVALRTVVDASPGVRDALFRSAARASGTGDPRIAATYDADEQPATADAGPVAYLVREWVEGEPLRTQLRDGGLDPDRLRVVMVHAAEAIAALHAGGGWHGRVHPDNVLVRLDGTIRVTDPGTGMSLAAAARADGGPGDRGDPPPPPASVLADLGLPPADQPIDGDPTGDVALLELLQREDTCDLGRLLYAASTGTWVGGAWRGMPGAPSDGERPRSPRHVRAAVPRDVDALVRGILLPTPGGPALLHRAADVAAGFAPVDLPEPPPASVLAPPRHRRRPIWATLLAVAVVLTVLALTLTRSPGRGVGPAGTTPRKPTVPTSAPAVAVGPPISLAAVSAFDPPPGDGQENDEQIPLAHDGSTATAWLTETYTTAALGGLKAGVGLVVDLGTAQQVSTVTLVLVGKGTSVQLRAADDPGVSLDAYPLVTTADHVGQSVTLSAHSSHRYWLIWLTALPEVDGGFRGGIAEMTFHS